MHLHSSLIGTAELYGRAVLGIRENDVVFSAAKLFFAYGLGNALTFPLAVGATAVLMAERPTPAAVTRPSQVASPDDLLRRADALCADARGSGVADARGGGCESAYRPAKRSRPTSAGAGPSASAPRSSTASARPRCSTSSCRTGRAMSATARPGSRSPATAAGGRRRRRGLRPGEIGDLLVAGPSAAAGYWNQRERSLSTFHGPWTRTGDRYTRDADGYYTYGGRADDMLKVGGIWVSPFEVEAALSAPGGARGRRRRRPDESQLVKPKAFVVRSRGCRHAGARRRAEGT